MPQLGVPELLIILVIIVVIFGVGRLPEIGGAIGKSIREFKTSVDTESDEPEEVAAVEDAAKKDISQSTEETEATKPADAE